FDGQAKFVDSVMPMGAITNAADTRIHDFPWAEGDQGTDLRSVHLNWSAAVKGQVRYRVRMDITD
ncbi:MAG: hypothetical protein AAFQ09_03415, partial [Pseudomonadota bacterium]